MVDEGLITRPTDRWQQLRGTTNLQAERAKARTLLVVEHGAAKLDALHSRNPNNDLSGSNNEVYICVFSCMCGAVVWSSGTILPLGTDAA